MILDFLAAFGLHNFVPGFEMGNINLNVEGIVIKRVSLSIGLDDFLNISKKYKTKGVVQLFDPGKVVDKNHVLGAYLNAKLSFAEGSNIAKSIGTEMLLFAAMTRQVKAAIERVGARNPDDVLLFATGAAYPNVRKYIMRERVFKPLRDQKASAARRLGIRPGKDTDAMLLSRMVSSRLAD